MMLVSFTEPLTYTYNILAQLSNTDVAPTIAHNCPTENGASGSPIIDLNGP